MKNRPHHFHIPVMGTSFTIDTPLKVARYGISSAISLVDDDLIEKMREHYSKKYQKNYERITNKASDYRAERIKQYLNLINELTEDEFLKVKYSEFGEDEEIDKYFDMLPDNSDLKLAYDEMCCSKDNTERYILQEKLRQKMVQGSIDTNIMTKLDKTNYKSKTEPLPTEYNDAHAALRGFAESDLTSTLILSAGMNPSLYAYLENFDDFYPDENGSFKKKIALKVSDYRSALIQGMYLAKKGLWVSEYRIESGLNCGGHAFATEGYLLGPILEEFKAKRDELIQKTFAMCQAALSNKGKYCTEQSFPLEVTVQGGIGNASENEVLLEHFNVDTTGWGSPFLLVPEATNVDPTTLDLLSEAGEDDLYLSDKSPLGVPMNSVKGNSKDLEREALIHKNRPGSSCPKKFLALNHEFTTNSICTASRQYQDLKIKELKEQELDEDQYQAALKGIEVKECLCAGLAASALVLNNINTKSDGTAVSICPGPNLAYFSKVLSLREMVRHIYGETNAVSSTSRPHMFIKELMLYVQHFKGQVDKLFPADLNTKRLRYLKSFKDHLLEGVDYYKSFFANKNLIPRTLQHNFNEQLTRLESEIRLLKIPEPLTT